MTEKNSHQRTLTFELERNTDEYDQNYLSIVGHIHTLRFVVVVKFIIFPIKFRG